MKLLYVSGMYCPSHGGAEISIHTLLKYLQKNYNIDVFILTDYRYTGRDRGKIYDTVKLYGIEHKSRKEKILNTIKNFKPDLIMTQLMWSDIALKLGKLCNIPTVLRVCKIPFNTNISLNSEYSPTSIIAISNAVKSYIEEKYNRVSEIMFPAIDLDKVTVPSSLFAEVFERKYITMFNPLIRKGGQTFKEITKEFPDKEFAIVYGWSSLKQKVNSKEFSDRYIRRISESLGIKFTGKKPVYADFTGCNNITVLEPTEDVWKIYTNTKILLVPSQWEEAFGRVAIEAMANGIPVIASNVAGLKESVAKGGILIKEHKNPSEWAKEIKKLDNKYYFKKTSESGKKRVSTGYSLNNIIDDTYNFLNKTITIHKNKKSLYLMV